MNYLIQLSLTMLDVFLTVESSLFDFSLIPCTTSKHHADAFIAEVFQRAGAFQL